MFQDEGLIEDQHRRKDSTGRPQMAAPGTLSKDLSILVGNSADRWRRLVEGARNLKRTEFDSFQFYWIISHKIWITSK